MFPEPPIQYRFFTQHHWMTVTLDLFAQNRLLKISYFCDPEVFHNTYGMGDFSNLSWTIAKISTEVVTI